MPVDDEAMAIVRAWINGLIHDRSWLWAFRGVVRPVTGPARDIFRRAFAAAGLPYYNPHSFRSMLVRHAMGLDLTPEEMKAWSKTSATPTSRPPSRATAPFRCIGRERSCATWPWRGLPLPI